MSKKPITTPVKATAVKYPHYAFQIFTGVLTLLMFQIIIFNRLNHIPLSVADKVVTLVVLLIFGIQALFNMRDERMNRRGV